MTRHWVYSPHAGGAKMTEARKVQVRAQVDAYATHKLGGRCDRIDVRYKGVFCYLDAEQLQPDGRVFHFPLGRLRHFNIDRWSIALYTFSNEKYEPSVYPSGEWIGTLEEALDFATMFLPE